MEGGHPGCGRLALDQRGVAGLHAGHVGDRVPPARPAAERYPEGPGTRLAGRRGRVRVGLAWRIHGHEPPYRLRKVIYRDYLVIMGSESLCWTGTGDSDYFPGEMGVSGQIANQP